MAPIKKKGFRLPKVGDQVLSLIAPIIGWTTSPVTGPASHNMGNSDSFAPKYLYIALRLLCCNPKLN